MTEIDKFEFLVLGSGEAGKYLAWTMANAGHRTAVVERRWIGGSCPNIACMPSKNVIWSAKVASLSGRGPEFGLPSASRVDMAAVRWRKRKILGDTVTVPDGPTTVTVPAGRATVITAVPAPPTLNTFVRSLDSNRYQLIKKEDNKEVYRDTQTGEKWTVEIHHQNG